MHVGLGGGYAVLRCWVGILSDGGAVGFENFLARDFCVVVISRACRKIRLGGRVHIHTHRFVGILDTPPPPGGEGAFSQLLKKPGF